MKTMWMVAALVAVGLAGCAEDGTDPTPVVPTDPSELEEGTGAIAGILVDDRFRPIHLTDDPQTEFAAAGFVLLQETGEQVQTTENGEFFFVDLDPGTYTIRVTADGHEATPQRVSVKEGVFNEASLVARRVASLGGTIITQEYAVFVACPVDALVVTYANPQGCFADLSGDSGRFDFWTDLTTYGDAFTTMVTEAKFNRPGWNDVVVREFDSGRCPTSTLGDCIYAEYTTQDEDYVKFVNRPGEVNAEHDAPRNVEFVIDYEIQTAIFPHPDNYGLLRPVAEIVDPPLAETGRSVRGIGPAMGVKAQFLQSIFLGEPEVDIDAYCVLCSSA